MYRKYKYEKAVYHNMHIDRGSDKDPIPRTEFEIEKYSKKHGIFMENYIKFTPVHVRARWVL